jgi:tRNA(Ile)-lysidine synthase
MIRQKLIDTIKKHNLIKRGDRIIVGVSGGPDSVALILLLAAISKEFSLKLHIAHLDHGLRPSSSKDRIFVENMAQSLEIPLTCAKISFKKTGKKGSIEELARNARFKFFFQVCRKFKARKIALGHTLDDQAETVLMRIIRGTGLYGLAGILPKRKFGSFCVVRPLIEIRRKEIEQFLKKKKIRACLDITNLQDLYFRNMIRNELIPLLERRYNKNIKEILANMAENTGSDYEYLLSRAKSLMPAKPDFELKKLSQLHPALKRLLLRQAVSLVKGNTRRITFRHIKEIEDLLQNRPANSIVDLPGTKVAKTEKRLIFSPKKTQ